MSVPQRESRTLREIQCVDAGSILVTAQTITPLHCTGKTI